MVRPVVWRPPAEPSPAELAVIKAVRRARLFVFLRLHRHELFDEQFQAELAQAYADRPKGQPPVPPARLALATILQAYTGVSDDEVIEATVMDRRWQLVLDCMGAEEPPFSKGTLVGFRKRLIEKNLDRRLIERTVELAARDRGVRPAGAAGGAGLVPAVGGGPGGGHLELDGTRPAQGPGRDRGAAGAGAGRRDRRGGGTSRGAAAGGLQPEGGAGCGLGRPGRPGSRCWPRCWACWTGWTRSPPGRPAAQAAAAAVAAARQVRDQDVDLTGPAPALRRGVAKDRRISVEDAESAARAQVPLGAVRRLQAARSYGTWIRPGPRGGHHPGQRAEASVAGDVVADLEAAGWHLSELHIDRAYLSSALVRDRGPDLAIFCKAWRVRNASGRFAKDQFTLDFAAGQLTCPAGVSMPFEPGRTVRFPAGTCAACPLQARCTASSNGRSVSIHPDEALLAELRRRQQTPDGRAKLRERVAVEHTLAHVGHWQGRRARYAGPARTCSTCAGSPWSITFTSSPASPPPTVTSSPPDGYLTGALGQLYAFLATSLVGPGRPTGTIWCRLMS